MPAGHGRDEERGIEAVSEELDPGIDKLQIALGQGVVHHPDITKTGITPFDVPLKADAEMVHFPR
jgi:hypothetical protein